mmetsp:Transcript_28/g.20  ORF Transcript_28/g.20 Transcript_28/m.20 type:complete len:138 (-) Transcript_28:380-793(-)
MDSRTFLLVSRLPLMERNFQQRMQIFSAANNISYNANEFNENIGIRFLGYDSILQFTLLAKLFIFMILFGVNAKGFYRWLILIFLICYYFHKIRKIYITHYEQQRRLLNLEANHEGEAPPPQGVLDRIINFGNYMHA